MICIGGSAKTISPSKLKVNTWLLLKVTYQLTIFANNNPRGCFRTLLYLLLVLLGNLISKEQLLASALPEIENAL